MPAPAQEAAKDPSLAGVLKPDKRSLEYVRALALQQQQLQQKQDPIPAPDTGKAPTSTHTSAPAVKADPGQACSCAYSHCPGFR